MSYLLGRSHTEHSKAIVGLLIVVPVGEELELISILVYINVWMKLSESSPKSPVVPLNFPVVLR